MDIEIVQPHDLEMVIKDVTQEYSSLSSKIRHGEKEQRSLQNQLGVSDWDDLWVLVEDGYYLIQMVVKDKDSRSVTITKNIEFESTFDKSLFTVMNTNFMKNEVLIKVNKAKDATKSIIHSSIKGYKLKDQKEVTLTSKIQVWHPTDLILLPKDEMWQLKAIGGTGSYRWSS